MVWAVSLSTMKLSPHCLTHVHAVVAFVVGLRVVTSTWPLAHGALYLHNSLSRGCTSIHFGENQLSPGSIGISPLPTVHPLSLQPKSVRTSTEFYLRFILTMGRSPSFGSTAYDYSLLAEVTPYSDSLSLRLRV